VQVWLLIASALNGNAFAALSTSLPSCSVPDFMFADFTDVQLNPFSCRSTKEYLVFLNYMFFQYICFLFIMLSWCFPHILS
jgi:hypothetical protein